MTSEDCVQTFSFKDATQLVMKDSVLEQEFKVESEPLSPIGSKIVCDY